LNREENDSDRRIVHVDIDAFFASVEQALVPSLRGMPVAVGSGCIASCSYEARARGLSAGMSLAKARRLCPELVIMPGSYGVYRCFAARVWELCREVAPAVETLLDDAYLDLSGTGRLYGDPRAPIGALRRRVRIETGLSLTAGIGPNRMIARLASSAAKPDGMLLVPHDGVEAFLVDRPVQDLPGVGPKTAELFRKLNVTTVRELRRVPCETLERLLGKVGAALHERAHGRDTRVVSTREIPGTISRETTFHRETTDPAQIHGMLYYLIERAMKAVREHGLVTRAVAVKIRYADFRGDDARIRLASPTDLEGDVYAAALKLLGRLHTRRVALRLIGVTMSAFRPSESDQLGLFEKAADARRERIAAAVDEIRSRVGFSAITAGKSLNLLGRLRQDSNGYVLRTPSLTK